MDTSPDTPVLAESQPLLSPPNEVESTPIEEFAIDAKSPTPLPAAPTTLIDPPTLPLTSPSLFVAPEVIPASNPASPISFLSHSLSGKSRTWTAKYYHPFTSSSSSSNRMQELPESYFSPTAGELQGAFNGLEKRRMELVDRPLLTRALREREEEGKERVRRERWPLTRIRVRFGDRSQLEGVFNSTETILSIYEFIRFALHEDHRQGSFLLYQTPPRREFGKTDLKLKGKSLIDLQLTPSSVFYIKFSDETLNHSSTPPLIPEILAAVGDLPIPPPSEAPTTTTTTKAVEKVPNTTASGKVMPNWMRKAKSGSTPFSPPRSFLRLLMTDS